MHVPPRTVQFSRFGGVDVLDVVAMEIPEPGPGEILVAVVSAAINHMEVYLRQGCFHNQFPTHFPQKEGSDFAGTVIAVGPGVTTVRPHMDVIGHADRASHATHIVVPEQNVIEKPQHLAWEVAGSLYLAGVTAHEVVHSLNITPGDVVVITAAAGGVGSMETSLATLQGAQIIGTCSEGNVDHLRNVGAIPVVYGDNLAQRIREAAPERVVNAYIDNVGDENPDIALELGVSEHRIRTVEARRKVEFAALSPDPGVEWVRILTDLMQLIDDHAMSVLISGYYPLDRVQEAFNDLDYRHARGKVVLGMNPVEYKYQRIHATGIRARDYR